MVAVGRMLQQQEPGFKPRHGQSRGNCFWCRGFPLWLPFQDSSLHLYSRWLEEWPPSLFPTAIRCWVTISLSRVEWRCFFLRNFQNARRGRDPERGTQSGTRGGGAFSEIFENVREGGGDAIRNGVRNPERGEGVREWRCFLRKEWKM